MHSLGGIRAEQAGRLPGRVGVGLGWPRTDASASALRSTVTHFARLPSDAATLGLTWLSLQDAKSSSSAVTTSSSPTHRNRHNFFVSFADTSSGEPIDGIERSSPLLLTLAA
ncbi:hypothetical protein L1887_58727 [Cichorium endivia]|nr:hypothetical protein L1887_58727 [Cichorium endivia]